MTWQDLVLAVCSLCFTAAMVPTILSREKPPLATAAMNVSILAVFAATLASLSLWYAAGTALSTCAAWAVVAVQVATKARALR